MLNASRYPASRNAFVSTFSLLLLVPLVISACISVDSDLVETPQPTPAATGGGADGSPTPAPIITPTPLPTPEPTPEPVAAEVLTFVPYWLLEDATADIDPSLVTIAAFHSVEASQDGRLVSKKPSGDVPGGWEALGSDEFAARQRRLQGEGVKVVPVVQRAAWTAGTRERAINLLSRKKNRTALVARIVQFVEARGFDGVNLDFEPIPAQVAEQYVTFVRELRAALDEIDPELHLSVDVVPGLENFDLAALTADDAADLAVIMGYGYTTRASGVAGSTAPLSGGAIGDLSTSVARALEQTAGDGDRLLLALPWYGYAWPTQGAEAGSRVRDGDDVGAPASAEYDAAVAGAVKGGRRYANEVLHDCLYGALCGHLAPDLVRRSRQLQHQDRLRPGAGTLRRGHLGPGHGRRARGAVAVPAQPAASSRRRSASRGLTRPRPGFDPGGHRRSRRHPR